ncbi:MAG: hypothetical protein KA054_01915 [Candidatus Moranbacteria bacterium]|nr:hypothetical protein [Candidatus Moranbacteria bacterium]
MMYWIYLVFLVLAVLTPLLITQGHFVLPEEELEGLAILLLGMAGFFVYFVKEKALFQLLRERLSLQKTTHNIQRDLSESYSYIGSMNRKQEIVKELLFDLSVRTANDSQYCDLWYRKILQTALELARVDAGSLRFVNVRRRLLLDHYEEGTRGNEHYIGLVPEKMLGQKKLSFECGGCYLVRSPRLSDGVAAFLVIPKQVNHFEDAEIFKMLAASALTFYSLSCQNPYVSCYADRH